MLLFVTHRTFYLMSVGFLVGNSYSFHRLDFCIFFMPLRRIRSTFYVDQACRQCGGWESDRAGHFVYGKMCRPN